MGERLRAVLGTVPPRPRIIEAAAVLDDLRASPQVGRHCKRTRNWLGVRPRVVPRMMVSALSCRTPGGGVH
jgi:hypothetical protein